MFQEALEEGKVRIIIIIVTVIIIGGVYYWDSLFGLGQSHPMGGKA